MKNWLFKITSIALSAASLSSLYATAQARSAAPSSQAQLVKPTKILIALDFGGSLKTTARLMAAGMEIKLNEDSKAKKNIELVKVNIGDDIKTTATQVAEAIKKEKPDVIIGAISSNQALVIGEIAEKNKVVFMTPFATNPKVTEGKRYVFRACFDDNFQAQQLARFAYQDLKLRRGFVLFNQDQAYSRGVKDIFTAAFIAERGTEISSHGFSDEKQITEDVINDLKAKNLDFVLIPSYQIESAALLSKLSLRLPKTVVYLGTDSWGGGRMFDKVVKNAGTQFQGYYVQHWSEGASDAANKTFLKSLKSADISEDLRFEGTAMNAPVAMGYDSMGLILAALKKGPHLDVNLRKLQHSGASGNMIFKESQTPHKKLFIYLISENGEKYFKEFQ